MPKKRKLIECKKTQIGTTSIIDEFGGLIRKVVIDNPRAKLNYLSITKLKRKIENSYALDSRLEVGVKYVTYFKFEENGTHSLERRYNRDTKTTYKKQLFLETEKGMIFIIDHNGQKNISFILNKLD